MSSLYLFIDESGNFDFSKNGTKHFVLTAVATREPVGHLAALHEIRYGLLSSGHDQEFFHATEDKQFVRDKAFDVISRLKDFEIEAVVLRKEHAQPLLRFDDAMYSFALESLLAHVFHRYRDSKDIDQMVVVVGALFTARKRDFIRKKLKELLKKKIKKPFQIYFHRVHADLNCQIADYCGWAIYVHFERAEDRPLRAIRSKIADVIEVF